MFLLTIFNDSLFSKCELLSVANHHGMTLLEPDNVGRVSPHLQGCQSKRCCHTQSHHEPASLVHLWNLKSMTQVPCQVPKRNTVFIYLQMQAAWVVIQIL